uniref:Uncharacterized protein n=1 Tax=Panagrolaimus sp. PS1159 TaxID=55785 RepID=A0AC35GBT4_9BILA
MIIFNSTALIVPGIIFLLIGHIPDAYSLLPILLFTTINAFIGTNCGGFYKCGTLVSRQFSAFVIANIQFIKCINLFLAPALVAIFVKDDANKSQWRIIFYILGVFSFIVSLLQHR